MSHQKPCTFRLRGNLVALPSRCLAPDMSRKATPVTSHTISVRLENKPGALARVSQLFSRRGYNIQSLAVGPTESSDISRLTLRVDCSEHSLEQIEKQMHKLVNVLRVVDVAPGESF